MKKTLEVPTSAALSIRKAFALAAARTKNDDGKALLRSLSVLEQQNPGNLREVLECASNLAPEITAQAFEQCLKDIEEFERREIGICFPGDSEYPENLLNIHRAPPVLFVMGNMKGPATASSPAAPADCAPEADDGIAFEIELEPASPLPSDECPAGKIFSLDLDSAPSAEEALSGLVGADEESKKPGSSPAPVMSDRDSSSASSLPEMNAPLFSFTDQRAGSDSKQPAPETEKLFSPKSLEEKQPAESNETLLDFSLQDSTAEQNVVKAPSPAGAPPPSADTSSLDFDLQIAPEPVEEKVPPPKPVPVRPVSDGPQDLKNESEADKHITREEEKFNLSVSEEDDLTLKPEPVIEKATPPEPAKKPQELARAVSVPPLSSFKPPAPPPSPAEDKTPQTGAEEAEQKPAEEFTEFPAVHHRPARKQNRYLLDVAIFIVMALVLLLANWYYFRADIPAGAPDSLDVDSSVQEVEKRMSELEASKALKAALEGEKTLFARNSSDDRSIEVKLTRREGEYKFTSLTIQRPAQAPLTNEEIVSDTVRPPWISRIETPRLPLEHNGEKFSATGPVMAYIEYNRMKARVSGLAEINIFTSAEPDTFEFKIKVGNITESQANFSWATRKEDGSYLFFFQDQFIVQLTE